MENIVLKPFLDFLQSFLLEHTNLADSFASITFDSSPGKFDSQGKPFIEEVSFTINSGTLFFLENLRQIGWHNKSYFVDCVDYIPMFLQCLIAYPNFGVWTWTSCSHMRRLHR